MCWLWRRWRQRRARRRLLEQLGTSDIMQAELEAAKEEVSQ